MTIFNEIQTSGDAFDAAVVNEVLPFADALHCRAGEKIVDSGGRADSFYFVEQGRFEVSYMARQTPIIVALIGDRQFIGEIGYFDREMRTRTVKALVDSKLRVFNHDVMACIRSEHPLLYGQFLEYVLEALCYRFRQILTDQGPLTAYAALLPTGKERFKGIQSIPAEIHRTPILREIKRDLEDFKAGMFDVAYRLQKEQDKGIPTDLQEQGEALFDQMIRRMKQFGPEVDRMDGAQFIWGYVFKEVFPYLMRSRLAERAYYKPKGYAGDFYMIELIYRNVPEGDGKIGELVDRWVLDREGAKAVRSRRRFVCRLLDRFCLERIDQDDPIRMMNLACGPARELFDLLPTCDYSNKIEAVCIDIDQEALQYADQIVNTGHHHANVRFMHENVIKWALGRTRHEFQPQDIIYSLGLCDYLDERCLSALVSRCYKQLKPGGVLIIGNFSLANPDRYFMDQWLYWRLIHRDAQDLRQIFAETAFGSDVDIIAEEQGVNLFAIGRK